MIAPYFVPRRRVGALRPFRFATRLQQYGWKPLVVTIKNSGSKLTERESELLKNINILEVAPPFDRTSPGSEKKTSPGKAEAESTVANWIDKHFPVDTWLPLFWISYLKILKRVREFKPDLVWSTGDPWSAHWVGEKLSNDLEIPWIADFRDPWTLAEIDLRERSLFSKGVDKKMENRVVEKSDRLVFTSARTELLYKNHFNLSSEKSAVIYNSFDDQMAYHANNVYPDLKINPDYCNLFFFGRFRRLSPVSPIIDMLEQIGRQDLQFLNKIRIHSFGMAEKEQLSEIEAKGFDSHFIYQEPVMPEQSLSVLKKADILLLSTNKVRSNIIPAKLWDYLAAGKPILSIAPNPEISDILDESGAGKQFSADDGNEVYNFIRQYAETSIDDTFTDQPGKGKYSADAATEMLAKIMDQLTQNG